MCQCHINRKRNKDSKKDNGNKLTQNSNSSTSDRAKDILKNKNFDSELNTARFVASLNFLHTNKLFNNPIEGSQYLNALITNGKGYSQLSVFNCVVNKINENKADVQIGVGGYSFFLPFILNAASASKLVSKIKRPHSIKLENVFKDKVEQVLLKLLNQ